MGPQASKAAVGIAKAGAKAATTGVLTYAIPFFGPLLASAINSLYAEGGDVQAINDKIKALAPEGAKFKVINTPEQLKQLIQDHPVETKKAGLTPELVDKAVVKYENLKQEQKAEFARGTLAVAKREAKMLKAMKSGSESGAVGMKPVKVKKERSPAQKAATAKMLAALKASKAKK